MIFRIFYSLYFSFISIFSLYYVIHLRKTHKHTWRPKEMFHPDHRISKYVPRHEHVPIFAISQSIESRNTKMLYANVLKPSLLLTILDTYFRRTQRYRDVYSNSRYKETRSFFFRSGSPVNSWRNSLSILSVHGAETSEPSKARWVPLRASLKLAWKKLPLAVSAAV